MGIGPLATDDSTEVLAFERPDGPVVLKAKAWPTGAGRVTITATPDPSGGTEVVIDEVPIAGPAKTFYSPALDALVHLRNIESLRRMEAALARSGS
jgi:hypothetical protein